MTQVWDEPEQWRTLAEEVRSEAEQITNGRAKQIMLNIAETHDRWRAGHKKGKSRPVMSRAAK
jgi:hypothetical protein